MFASVSCLPPKTPMIAPKILRLVSTGVVFFFFLSSSVSRALRYKLLIVPGIQITDVRWVSEALTFPSHAARLEEETETRLMTTALRPEAAENEQISVRERDIC